MHRGIAVSGGSSASMTSLCDELRAILRRLQRAEADKPGVADGVAEQVEALGEVIAALTLLDRAEMAFDAEADALRQAADMRGDMVREAA